MFALIRLLTGSLIVLFRSRASLAAEIMALRHQLGLYHRTAPARPRLTRWDRVLWALILYRWSGWRRSLIVVQPETVIKWHRRAFRLFWRWKSRGGRPSIRCEIRGLIREMARSNPTWGAPRIHAELLSLERRRLVFANVTANATAEWLGQQVVNAFPWDTAPEFLLRDRDGAYGFKFSRRTKGLGIRDGQDSG